MVKLVLLQRNVISFAQSLVSLNQKVLYPNMSKLLWQDPSVLAPMSLHVCLPYTTSLKMKLCSTDSLKIYPKLLRLADSSLVAASTAIKSSTFYVLSTKDVLKLVRLKIPLSGLSPKTMIKKNYSLTMTPLALQLM